MLTPVSVARLSKVHPRLANLIRQLDGLMPAACLQVTQGLRTWDEQEALYAQGRDSLAVVNAKRALVGWAEIVAAQNLRPVTNAEPGMSWHNFGLAVDLVPEDVTPGQPDWNLRHPVWHEMMDKGTLLGLKSGDPWHDDPHFQLTGRFGVNPDLEVQNLFRSGGLNAVWRASGIEEV